MSYYTYFRLKKDSKYKDWKPSNRDKDNSYSKTVVSSLFVTMIQAYYDDNAYAKVKNITAAVRDYVWNKTYNSDEDYLTYLYNDEDHEIQRNRPQDEYEMLEEIENWEDNVSRITNSLIILATVRFKVDDRYSDTSKTEMDYLQYEYINKIKEELDVLDEYIYDYCFAKFITENCVRRTEDEENWPDDNNQVDE